jgi:ribonucleoside-diphosphate reductase beta chain
MRLWERAKRLGIWNPAAIDFSRDRLDWARLEPLEREVILHLSAMFQAGEESVALDLLPLIEVVAREGRLEEEIYLTSFLWEEAKHVELFRRFLDDVARDSSDLTRFHGENYRKIFYEELPSALRRLENDPSPRAVARASVTYNLIVEGVLAETGYHAYHEILVRNDLMPGMCSAVVHLKSDEARHLAYGVFLLSRLIAEHGDSVWEAIDKQMNALMPRAIGTVSEIFEGYDRMPFGLTPEDFTVFAMTQFQKRYARLERARSRPIEEILHASDDLGEESETPPVAET